MSAQWDWSSPASGAGCWRGGRLWAKVVIVWFGAPDLQWTATPVAPACCVACTSTSSFLESFFILTNSIVYHGDQSLYCDSFQAGVIFYHHCQQRDPDALEYTSRAILYQWTATPWKLHVALLYIHNFLCFQFLWHLFSNWSIYCTITAEGSRCVIYCIITAEGPRRVRMALV